MGVGLALMGGYTIIDRRRAAGEPVDVDADART